jgi:hydroxymethylglutaryl-CoA lyase
VSDILLHEVGLRDGLQVESTIVPTERKIEWANKLAASGVDAIQLGSFVHPSRVPQMADTDKLFEHFARPEHRLGGMRLSALVLNEKGLERGLRCGVTFFCMGVSASDTHSRKNTGMGRAEALDHVLHVADRAREAGAELQLSVQSAFGCGFEGPVPAGLVLDFVNRFVENGFTRISLADTAGHAHPAQVEWLFDAVHEAHPTVECACHFHDTYGLALANCHAALKGGVRYFESAFGGLGGCPFTAVAAGNVATEDLVHLMHRQGLRRDIRLDLLVHLAQEASQFFRRKLPGTVYRTGPVPEIARGALDAARESHAVEGAR